MCCSPCLLSSSQLPAANSILETIISFKFILKNLFCAQDLLSGSLSSFSAATLSAAEAKLAGAQAAAGAATATAGRASAEGAPHVTTITAAGIGRPVALGSGTHQQVRFRAQQHSLSCMDCVL